MKTMLKLSAVMGALLALAGPVFADEDAPSTQPWTRKYSPYPEQTSPTASTLVTHTCTRGSGLAHGSRHELRDGTM